MAIAGLVCEEYGNPDEDLTGGYHCRRQICAPKEYCEGEEEIFTGEGGQQQVACMGKCTPIPYTDALASIVPHCISSADRGNAAKDNGCVYLQNRRYGACMVDNRFVVYDFSGTGAVALSTLTLRVQNGSAAPLDRAPFLACMEADG